MPNLPSDLRRPLPSKQWHVERVKADPALELLTALSVQPALIEDLQADFPGAPKVNQRLKTLATRGYVVEKCRVKDKQAVRLARATAEQAMSAAEQYYDAREAG